MNLLKFLRTESTESWKLIFTMAAMSGVANGVLLAIINAGADTQSVDKGSQFATPYLVTMFVIGMAIFVSAKRLSLVLSTQIVENMVKSLRVRVCDKIRNSELAQIEKLDKGDAFTRISQDTNVISQTSFVLISAAQEVIMLACCLVYLAWLSLFAFLLTVGGSAIAICLYQVHSRSVHTELKAVTDKESELFSKFSHILYGFRELRLNRRKSDSLFHSLTDIADDTRDSKAKVAVMFITTIMFSQIFFYSLIAVIVFILPQYIPTYSDVIMKTTATILFIIGPLSMVVSAGPVLSRSDVALDNLYELESRLDVAAAAEPDQIVAPLTSFKQIAMNAASFSYTDKAGQPTFTVGPVDLSLTRGELLFIVGGNGSGKSTLLKLLTGLYLPSHGAVTIDHRPLNATTVQGYRELISAVFSDFHLFDQLYGMQDVEQARVAELITAMELDDKVQFQNGRFSTLDLSTGQRKRLALIIALLEDKDILVFDEWAADQDQHFRRHFYEDILADLKAKGKTVLAVTHDDRYWHVADRVIKLEFGKIVADETIAR